MLQCHDGQCNFSIKKIIALVNALTKLHNFCIKEQDGTPDSILVVDHEYLMCNEGGYIGMVSNDTHDVPVLEGIMDFGYHFQVVTCAHWRGLNNNNTDEELPKKNAQ